MRSPEYIAFVLARTLEWIAEHPPTGPLLGEPEQPPATTCQQGHAAMVQQARQRRCAECRRAWKRRAYRARKATS